MMTTAKILGHLGIEKLSLQRGGHKDRDAGVCLLEAVAWFAGEPHSDHPKCTDRVLGAYGRVLNDRLRDDERQGLVELIPLLVGTAGSGELSQRRRFLLVDRTIRRTLPLAYRSRGDTDWAEKLESLREIVDTETAEVARNACAEVRRAAAYAAYAADAAYATAAYAAYADAYAAAYATDAAADAVYTAYAYAASADARSEVVKSAIEAFREAIALR